MSVRYQERFVGMDFTRKCSIAENQRMNGGEEDANNVVNDCAARSIV